MVEVTFGGRVMGRVCRGATALITVLRLRGFQIEEERDGE